MIILKLLFCTCTHDVRLFFTKSSSRYINCLLFPSFVTYYPPKKCRLRWPTYTCVWGFPSLIIQQSGLAISPHCFCQLMTSMRSCMVRFIICICIMKVKLGNNQTRRLYQGMFPRTRPSSVCLVFGSLEPDYQASDIIFVNQTWYIPRIRLVQNISLLELQQPSLSAVQSAEASDDFSRHFGKTVLSSSTTSDASSYRSILLFTVDTPF